MFLKDLSRSESEHTLLLLSEGSCFLAALIAHSKPCACPFLQGDTSNPATPTNVLEMMRLFRDDPDEGEEQEGSESSLSQSLEEFSLRTPSNNSLQEYIDELSPYHRELV